ncbi:MAG: response regulator [Fermentimonas sp.]|nr:response regulator [Fermentimonas sp.]
MRIKTTIIINLFCVIAVVAQQGNHSFNEYNFSYLTIDNGLSDNSVHAIHKDYNSFMWFGTSYGLERFDGYEFKHYSDNSDSPNLFIESSYIHDIKEDKYHNLWIASDAGIFRIDLQRENIIFFKNYEGENKEILTSPVQTIFIDEYQNLLIGSNNSFSHVILNSNREVTKVNLLKNEVDVRSIEKHGNDIWVGGNNLLLRYSFSSPNNYVNIPIPSNIDISDQTINCFFSFGDYLWAGTTNGLYGINTISNYYTHYQHDPKNPQSISSNIVMDIEKNDSGEIIVATRNGINILSRTNQFVVIKKESESKSLNSNIINKIFIDDDYSIWAGTDLGGVNILEPKQISYTRALNNFENGNSLIISAVIEDKQGNILVGIVDGGLAIKRKGENNFSFYKHDSETHNSLGSNNITDIVQDFKGDYWISTIGGGIQKLLNKNLSNPIFEHFTKENSGLVSNDVHDIHIDSLRNSLWICTSSHIQSLDFSTQSINRLRHYSSNREVPANLNTIFVDSKSRLWIGGNGVYVIDLTDYRNGYESIHYKHKLDDPESKIIDKITTITETKSGDIYIGSRGNGLYMLNRNSAKGNYTFTNFAGRAGLTETSVSSIIEDEYQNLWISTFRGIYIFNTFSNKAIKFDIDDGLPIQQFYQRSGCKTADNLILLGTTDGLIEFNTQINLPKEKERTVTLTQFISNGREKIPYIDNKNLKTSIIHASEIHLFPPENSFEISFSALDYQSQNKIYYFHRIVELDNKIKVGLVNRNAKYTNLDPGKYTFEVWCTNRDNTWSSEHTFLTIHIHPPFFKTTWFYSLIILLCMAIISYVIISYYQRQKNIQKLLKTKIEESTAELVDTITKLEDSQADITDKNNKLQAQNEEINKQKNEIYKISSQMEEMNKEKLSYFINTAHEFKTPLTLILGPTAQLLSKNKDISINEDLEMIERNARYLISMVNQLIDLQKIDTNNMILHPTTFNLEKLLNQTASDFSSLFNSSDIELETYYKLSHDFVVADKENIHKILFNLLSNAVKYTPNMGKVIIHANQFRDLESGQLLQYISVTNSGSVIDDDEKEIIFNRYYRSSKHKEYSKYGQSSTGIGLHIVKKLVDLLNGTIVLKSSENIGVSFRFYFPISVAENIEIVNEQAFSKPVTIEDTIIPFIPIDKEKSNLLLVEDNPDMRAYIKKILSSKFNVAEANNGEAGFEEAKKIIPDIIVSDLMMPKCDGANLCKRIRENIELCHIPFLLLTANSSEKSYIESFEKGIDGYITKPFDETMLMVQIESIMKNLDLRQKRFIDGEMNLSELDAGYTDQQFMKEVIEIIDKNYEDSNFGVKELVVHLNMSYTIVYKKFITLSGIPPVKFILLYRLKVAKRLLEINRNNNVSEVAYRVGFNDPKYFTRCFVKQYNITPSSIISQETF